MSPQEIASKATPRFKSSLERLVTDEDVVDAISGIQRTSDLAELKALAYAVHLGALEIREFSRRLGPTEAVVKTIQSFLNRLPAIDSNGVAEVLSQGVAGYHGHASGNNKDEGWALTLFDALYQSGDAHWVNLLVLEDPARIGIRWATQGILSMEDSKRVVVTWAAIGDTLHIAAAGLLVLASVDSEIAGNGLMIDISPLPRLPRAVIAGRVIGELLRRRRNSNQFEKLSTRLNEVTARLTPKISSWMQTPGDLRQFIHGAGVPNDEELVAFLLTLPFGPRLKREAEGEGDALLRKAFQRVATRFELEERQLMYVAGWMINPLAHTAISIRIGPERFEELLDNLAFDEYAHDFNYSLYLNDRVRAILLCAIGAIVAKINSETTVGDMARDAGTLLKNLPAGFVMVFDDEVLKHLESEYGITLPSK